MHAKRQFLSYRKHRHDAQIIWSYAYYVTLGSRCKMANSSSEDETNTSARETHRQAEYMKEYRNIMSASKQNPCGIPWGLRNRTHWSARYTNGRDAAQQERSFELYKFNSLSPHCGSIARELVHRIPGVVCELLQFAATQQASIVNFFVDHTHTQFTEESKMVTALTPQTLVTSGKSRDWWRTRVCSLGQPTESIID